MLKNYTELKTDRFERKFLIERFSKSSIEVVIKQNPVFFFEIFRERFINNIYFDTPNLTFFYDNVVGKSNRKKIRIRWYGDFFGEIQTPVLEFKLKNGYTGKKKSFPLIDFNLNKNFNIDYLKKEVFNKS